MEYLRISTVHTAINYPYGGYRLSGRTKIRLVIRVGEEQHPGEPEQGLFGVNLERNR